ncbi:MAG: radical SAM protein [Spirochaetales bacterium]|nr:radical SAM protein [Spirochaetales bacterium]
MPDNHKLYRRCLLCPRACGIDRSRGRTGFCRGGTEARAAVACLHRGEEPPISGERGSGTVFFSSCTLGCAACQNYSISSGGRGAEISDEVLASVFLALQERGAHTINLVTASHYAPSVIAALEAARAGGLILPVVWNSSGYESAATLDLIDPFVDVYLPDLKTLDEDAAHALFGRRDYPAAAREALSAMTAAKPLRWDGESLAQGVIVRHLVLPGRVGDSFACLRWFRERLAGRALLSLMFQYLPLECGSPTGGPRVSRREYDEVMEEAERLGLEDGFIQDLEEADDWLPDFGKPNPFPEGFAEPVWHADFGFFNANPGQRGGTAESRSDTAQRTQ